MRLVAALLSAPLLCAACGYHVGPLRRSVSLKPLATPDEYPEMARTLHGLLVRELHQAGVETGSGEPLVVRVLSCSGVPVYESAEVVSFGRIRLKIEARLGPPASKRRTVFVRTVEWDASTGETPQGAMEEALRTAARDVALWAARTPTAEEQ